MALVVKNNLSAASTLNKLNQNNGELAKSLKKVSSGMRIHGAGDGASEYSIGEKMEVMMRSLGQDIDNTQTGRNLVRTAEGGIQEIINNIREMKEMALNSANGHNSDIDREILQKDFSARMRTIADIAATTNYNGRVLLNGDYSEWRNWTVSGSSSSTGTSGGNSTVSNLVDAFSPLQAAQVSNQMVSFRGQGVPVTNSFESVVRSTGQSAWNWPTAMGLPNAATSSQKDQFAVSADFSAMQFTGSLPAALDGQGFSILCGTCDQYINIKFDANTASTTYTPKSGRSREFVIGVSNVTSPNDLAKAIFDGIASTSGGGRVPIDSLTGSALDADTPDNVLIDNWAHELRMAKDPNDPTKYVFLKNTRYASPNENSQLQFLNEPIEDGSTPPTPPKPRTEVIPGNPLIIHTGPKANQHLRVYINSMHPIAMGLNAAAVNPWERAVQAIDIVDKALDYALNENVRMGAYQVRLNETEDNLVTAEENTTSSMSNIRDADMAKEMATYTKNNVLTQSAQSMLSQANQNVGGVLDLLQ